MRLRDFVGVGIALGLVLVATCVLALSHASSINLDPSLSDQDAYLDCAIRKGSLPRLLPTSPRDPDTIARFLVRFVPDRIGPPTPGGPWLWKHPSNT